MSIVSSVTPGERPVAQTRSGLWRILAPRKSLREETVNQWTHGLGFVLCVAGCYFLWEKLQRVGELHHWIGCGIFAATMTTLFLASTLSHSFDTPRPRHFFRTVDQICIYFFMAGGFTPFAIQYLCEGTWWIVLAASWAFAILGSLLKLHIAKLKTMGIWSYMLVGWTPFIGSQRLFSGLPWGGIAFVAAAASLYMIGTYFFVRDSRYRYYHAVWHLLVVAASSCVFFAVYFYLLPPNA